MRVVICITLMTDAKHAFADSLTCQQSSRKDLGQLHRCWRSPRWRTASLLVCTLQYRCIHTPICCTLGQTLARMLALHRMNYKLHQEEAANGSVLIGAGPVMLQVLGRSH